MTRLLGLSGALRKASTNTGLLHAVATHLPASVEFEIATLHGIPLYDGDHEVAEGKPEAVQVLDQRIRSADGIIIATPEYNYSIPGVLKNATDWLSRGDSPFVWKRVGVLGASIGILGTARAQLALRQNLQGLQAIVMPKPEIFASISAKRFDAQGNLQDEETHRHLAKWVQAFLDWVEKKP